MREPIYRFMRTTFKIGYLTLVVYVISIIVALSLILFVAFFDDTQATRKVWQYVFDTPAEKETERPRLAGPQFVKEGILSIIGVAGDTIRTIDIEIADTESERTIGLMHRRSMPDTQGMLFIFDEEEQRSFWMRNTLIGLDIIYIRANGEIESIAKYTVPMSERSVPSKGPATYVLEVIEGFCDRYNVKEGDKVAFSKAEAL